MKPPAASSPEQFWEGVLDQALVRDSEKLIDEQRALAAAAPDDPRPYCNLGILYYMRGQVEDAIAMHEQALARDPGFALPHQHLGQIHIVLGNYEKAWVHARRAAELGNAVVLEMLKRYPKVTRSTEEH